MRDFRDAKAMVTTLRQALADKGLKISNSETLELVARMFGARDWNTLAAAINAAETAGPSARGPVDNSRLLDGLAKALGLEDWDKLVEIVRGARSRPAAAGPRAAPQPLDPEPAALPTPGGRTVFSEALQATLDRAVAHAAERDHEYTTLEHLLLSLLEDPDASAVLDACSVDQGPLRAMLTGYIDEELKSLVGGPGERAPTAGFHRVVQRAIVHVQSAGRDKVTGANILVAIFSERESYAARLLQQVDLTRMDAVSFIAHGIRKEGGQAA